jgi:hypothetical protein
VIIGYDARHNSDIFASDTAEIMAGAGFEALIVARSAADSGRRLRHRALLLLSPGSW